MQRKIIKKVLSLMMAAMLLCMPAMNVNAATRIEIDMANPSTFTDGDYSSYSVSNGEITLKSGYEFVLNGVGVLASNINNYGVIVSTDGAIDKCWNYGTINGGTFSMLMNNAAGTFNNGSATSAQNYGTINNGTFSSMILSDGVFKYGTVSDTMVLGGGSIEKVTLTSGASITDGVFSLDGPGTYAYKSSTGEFAPASPGSNSGGSTPGSSTSNSSSSSASKSNRDKFDSYTDSLDKLMENGKPGETVIFDASKWHSLPITTIKNMQKHNDVVYEIQYVYRGEKFKVIVPIGATFDDSIPWYGPYKMSSLFGKTMME